MAYTYPIQASGSELQLVLHSKRSHDNHPMGGVRASPLSSPATRGESSAATHSNKDKEAAILKASVPLKYIIYVLDKGSTQHKAPTWWGGLQTAGKGERIS